MWQKSTQQAGHIAEGRRHENHGLALPYDGITRTGSKGLSQRHRHRCSTPNVTAQITGIKHFMQDTLDFDAIAAKFVPGVSGNTAKVFIRFSVKPMMSKITKYRSSNMHVKLLNAFAAIFVAVVPVMASAAWQAVTTEQGKRVEIDRSSIVAGPSGQSTAKGRIVLDKPIVDPKTSASYRIIEVSNRFNCAERTLATLKRSYFKDEGELLRQEEVRAPFDMPVRSGTPDDKLFREVCRPKPGSDAVAAASKTAEKVNEAAGDLRKANEALIEKEVRKEEAKNNSPRPTPRPALASPSVRSYATAVEKKPAPLRPAPVSWSYDGSGGPDNWDKLKPEYALCASGRRQSPIDIRDGIAVDLEPIQFAYWPAPFRVADTGRFLQVTAFGGSLSLLGKNYELIQIQFHRPSEITVEGRTFEMEAQLVHKSQDGKLLILAVPLVKGEENQFVQTAVNNLPLEKGSEVSPPAQSIDVTRLLPENRRYFTFMGSLTTPPCTEEVLWLVFMYPQQISLEQLAIFQRLYKHNARPVQPGFGRIIKQSR